jgi:hypothetical protein
MISKLINQESVLTDLQQTLDEIWNLLDLKIQKYPRILNPYSNIRTRLQILKLKNEKEIKHESRNR